MATKGMTVAGMKLGYIVASGASVPTSGTLINIPEVKTVPSFNPTPGSVDITTIDETDFRQYAADLKDFGGVLEFSANLTNELETVWNTTLMTAFEGKSSTSEVWFCVSHPKLTNATWFYGDPVELGMNEASVGGALETTLYIAPKCAPVMAAKLA